MSEEEKTRSRSRSRSNENASQMVAPMPEPTPEITEEQKKTLQIMNGLVADGQDLTTILVFVQKDIPKEIFDKYPILNEWLDVSMDIAKLIHDLHKLVKTRVG